jgi:signal transduction histidine kinase
MVFFMDLYILIAILVRVSQRKPIAYFYMIGFVLTLMVGTLLILANIGVIDGINQNAEIFYFTPLIEILVLIVGFGVIFSNNLRERNRFQVQLSETQRSIITIQENERKRIGQDLHDDVGNTLAAIKSVLSNKYPTDAAIKDMVEKAILMLKQISHNLMPVDFKKNHLGELMQQAIRKFSNSNLSISFIEAGQRREIPVDVALEIYRIFNEILHNVYSHSQASEATIQLIYQEESLVFSVEDNGPGFDFEKTLQETEGIGLKNIISRAKVIDAKLTIQSDHRGTLILIDHRWS